jgi:glycosyltransferase involved in cell wall biosynthesis/GT2 family glycosyltransferase
MSAQPPSFSAIIATKGRPGDLAQTLASLSRADPAPMEVLVVDGDEGRSAEAVVEAARSSGGGPSLRYVHSAPGLTLQRNRGVREARGDIMVFLDDDVDVDTSLFTALERAYRDPEVVGATGRVIEGGERRFGNKRSAVRRLLFRGEEGTLTRFGYPRRLQDLDRERDVELMQGCLMSGRREIVEEVGFDEHLTGYALAEDEDFSYRLSRVGQVRYLPDAIVDHKNTGFRSTGTRRFNRDVAVNRTYLFRKNFRRTPLARLQFAGLILVLVAHRALNGEWEGVRGLFEGSLEAWRDRARPLSPRAAPVGVSFVSSHALGGGSERYLELLLERLGEDWVRGVVLLQEGPFAERLRSLGYPVEIVPTPRRAGIFPAALRLRRALLGQGPQVVHANGVKAAMVAAIAMTGTGIPVLWLKHDFSWDGPLARLVAWRCRTVVAVSSAITTIFGPWLARRVRVVPNGIPEYTRDRESGRRAIADLTASTDAPTVLLVGRLHPAKGQIELVEAAPLILERRPDVRFVLLGDEDPTQPAYAEGVRRRVAELGIDREVVFAGHRSDPLRIMSGSDVIVLPSVPDERGAGKEACPFALLEAMAVETPVVAYAAGGIPEVLGDCGRLVAEGDRAALADAIVGLIEDEDERRRAAACGRERVRTRHSLEATVEAMRRAYRETAGQ